MDDKPSHQDEILFDQMKDQFIAFYAGTLLVIEAVKFLSQKGKEEKTRKKS